MAVTRKSKTDIYRIIQNMFGDPKKRWCTDAYIDDFLYDAMKEIWQEAKFEKSQFTVKGDTHIAALGTTPRMYQMPENFICFDQCDGVLTNGLRRLGTSSFEVDSFQQKALSNYELRSSGMTTTVSPDDYFSESISGIILHYALECVWNEIKDATGAVLYQNDMDDPAGGTKTGNLLWLLPNPQDADLLTFNYFCVPDVLPDATTYTRIPITFDELLILGTAKRIAGTSEVVLRGWCNQNDEQRYSVRYRGKMGELQKMLSNTTPDKEIRFKTAAQRDGRYNSAGAARHYGNTSGIY